MIIYYIIYYHMLYIKSTVVLLCFYILNTLRFNTSCFCQAASWSPIWEAIKLSTAKTFPPQGSCRCWKVLIVLILEAWAFESVWKCCCCCFFLNAFWTWTPAWSQEHVCALIFFVCFFGGMVMTIVENRMMDIMLWFMICDILLLLAVSSQIACQYSTAHASGPIYGTGSCHESCTRRWDIREMWRWVT